MIKRVATILLSILGAISFAQAQTIITGTVLSKAKKMPLEGATIVIQNKPIGTSTDAQGNFSLKTSEPLPLTINVLSIGYLTQEVRITEKNQSEISINLEEQIIYGEAVIISASKIEESVLEAPVTIEQMDLRELIHTTSFDAYGALTNIKGVQTNNSSLTFTSVNTRGFADIQNWRFVQLVDGVDVSAPGLNYAVGGNSAPSDLDIASMELVPGANSALYGANAFNGLLAITTKDPFDYTGLSAYAKVGITAQEAGGSHPLYDFGLRYAQSFKDRFAFKVNFSYLTGTDWTAKDESHYISPANASQAENLLNRPRTDPNFDAVNVYGDEVVTFVALDDAGTVAPINRTGIKESDIIDYEVESIKFNTGLHYRLADSVTASYNFNFTNGDVVLRHTTIYPLVNFRLYNHNFQVNAPHWNLKAYFTREDAKDSYAMLATGAFLEQGRKPNDRWNEDYSAAFRGILSDVTAGDHQAAREYADRDLISIGSPAYQILLENTLSNPDISTGGSKFIDNTSVAHFMGEYRFKELAQVLNLQVGGSYRRYKLDSDGELFNDGPSGFNGPILAEEQGAYLQVGKRLADQRLHLRGSLRYDKHQDFEGRLTPRISSVLSVGTNRVYNLRASFQTGYRNPAAQEAYIALNIGRAVILGGVENNIKNYNFVTEMNQQVNGLDIHSTLVTAASFIAFQQGGGVDPTLLRPADLSFLEQERNTTFELGYNGLIDNKFFIDLNYYHTTYKNFVVRNNTVSPLVGQVFAVYTNIDENITSDGIGLGLKYWIGTGYQAGINYTYTSFNADDAIANNPELLPSFNTPKSRLNLSLSNYAVSRTSFGFNANFRYWSDYQWQSPFGLGNIPSKGIVDLAVSYKVKPLKSMFKLGANNLLKNEYRTVYGGPQVGAVYYVSWTYDRIFGQ